MDSDALSHKMLADENEDSSVTYEQCEGKTHRQYNDATCTHGCCEGACRMQGIKTDVHAMCRRSSCPASTYSDMLTHNSWPGHISLSGECSFPPLPDCCGHRAHRHR